MTDPDQNPWSMLDGAPPAKRSGLLNPLKTVADRAVEGLVIPCSDCGETIKGTVFVQGTAMLCGHCAHCPAGSDCADTDCPCAGPVPKPG